MRDGSRPSVAGLQEQATNYRKRHCLKGVVVSITEKALKKRRQVWIKKTNNREPPFKCRKSRNGIKTGEVMLPQDQIGGNLFTGQLVPGIEVA